MAEHSFTNTYLDEWSAREAVDYFKSKLPGASVSITAELGGTFEVDVTIGVEVNWDKEFPHAGDKDNCPKCGSAAINQEYEGADDDYSTYSLDCDDCSFEWEEVHYLRFRELEANGDSNSFDFNEKGWVN